MAEFKPTDEAVEAVAKALEPDSLSITLGERPVAELHERQAHAAIAAFVEAEGLRLHGESDTKQVRGPWRKRD